MYGTTTDMSTRDAMAALRKQGFVTAIVHFSGGNDEGGADGFVGVKADGEQVRIDGSDARQDQEYDPVSQTWKSTGWVVHSWGQDRSYTTRPATPEEIEHARICEVLEGPIYDQYGSFAGEFYVDGTCTWDVATGKAEMHGHYQSMVGEDF
jgi:hypothetical protein